MIGQTKRLSRYLNRALKSSNNVRSFVSRATAGSLVVPQLTSQAVWSRGLLRHSFSTEALKPDKPSFMEFEFKTIAEMQTKACKTYADNRLFGVRNGNQFDWLNYRDFGKMVDNTRKVLKELGVGYNSKVAVISNNRVEWAAIQFAAQSLGGLMVPMYEQQLETDWQHIIGDCGATVLVVATHKIFDVVKDYPGKVGQVKHLLSFENDAPAHINFLSLLKEAESKPDVPIYPVAEEDLATIIYTSGTTGKPKGVELMHKNIVSVIIAQRFLNKEILNKPFMSLAFLPWAHVYGMATELSAMTSAGCAMAIVPHRDQLIECIGIAKPTMIASVPVFFNRVFDGVMKNIATQSALKQKLFHFALANARKRNHNLEFGQAVPFHIETLHSIFDKLVFAKIREKFGGNLKFMGSGGAAASMQVLQFFEDIGLPICEGYGLTETSPIVAANSIDWSNKRLGTVGPALQGVEVRCVDPDTLESVPPGQVGEIVVSGPNVMRGYHNQPKATDEVIFFKDNKRFFRTGDMGCLVEGKFLKVTGRIKEQFKLENGKYVVPAPLEDIYSRGPFIMQTLLYGANCPFTVLLVVPNLPELRAWATKHKKTALLQLFPDVHKPPALYTEEELWPLYCHEDVVSLITAEIQRHGQHAKNYEHPQIWYPLPRPFSQENQMLTPKMSLRRANIVKEYQHQIDMMYAQGGMPCGL